MKNLKYAMPFLLVYSLAFVPLFWPYQLIRFVPYGIMFYLMANCLKGTQIKKTFPYSVFWLGVFFDIAPFFSVVPFITTLLILGCFFIMLFSEKITREECFQVAGEGDTGF